MGFLDVMEEIADDIDRKARQDRNKVAANSTLKKLDNETLNYVILENQDLQKLEEFVSSAIRKGWIPAGGISHIPSEGGCMFEQAVYRNARK